MSASRKTHENPTNIYSQAEGGGGSSSNAPPHAGNRGDDERQGQEDQEVWNVGISAACPGLLQEGRLVEKAVSRC